MIYTTTAGAFDRNRDSGYGGIVTASANNGGGWCFGRIYNNDGAFGSWAVSVFTVGTHFQGHCYGRVNYNNLT